DLHRPCCPTRRSSDLPDDGMSTTSRFPVAASSSTVLTKPLPTSAPALMSMVMVMRCPLPRMLSWIVKSAVVAEDVVHVELGALGRRWPRLRGCALTLLLGSRCGRGL